MLEYDKTDITEGIDVDKTNKSRECMFCHYWYWLNKNFSYGPFTCDGCYNIVQKSTDFKILLLFMLKKAHTEFILKILVKIKQKNLI